MERQPTQRTRRFLRVLLELVPQRAHILREAEQEDRRGGGEVAADDVL